MLRFGRHRELAERFRVDVALAVGVQDRIDQLRDRKPPLDEQFGHAELAGDVGDAAPLRRESGEGFVLVDLVHGQARDVLGKRGLDRHGVIAGFKDRARDGIGLAGFLRERLAGRRRCPAITSKPSQLGRTSKGWMTPRLRMRAISSPRSSAPRLRTLSGEFEFESSIC